MKTKSTLLFLFAAVLFILPVTEPFGAIRISEIVYSEQDKNFVDIGIPVKKFEAVFVDNDNTKWFLTDAGIISFNGEKWTLHNQNGKVDSAKLQGIALESASQGQELWMATSAGALVANLPVDAGTKVNSFNTKNSSILSDSVIRVAVGQRPLRWFGTPKGISALKADKWLTPSYDDQYPAEIFEIFPILSMATDIDGDTLYVGMKGAGVTRVFSNDVDGITGASVYAQWGPILLPSDSIYSICIQPNNVKWFGTDMGVARHIGQNTLENWDAFTTDEGLINNFVQAIAADNDGNVWFGTKGGISVFNGEEWKSYTQKDGLISDNVLCIVVDKAGVIWIGTDKGVSSFNHSEYTNYQ